VNESEHSITYCGFYCGDCFNHKGEIADLARDLRKKLRAAKFDRVSQGLSQFFKEFKDYDKCYKLLGLLVKMRCNRTCRGNGGPPDCKIRNCARKNKFEGCWECDDFASCEKLKILEPHHGVAHLKNLRKIKKLGTTAFVKEKKHWYAVK